MATGSVPKRHSLSVRAVRVPMREPHRTASGAVAVDGMASVAGTWATGVAWDEAAVERYPVWR